MSLVPVAQWWPVKATTRAKPKYMGIEKLRIAQIILWSVLKAWPKLWTPPTNKPVLLFSPTEEKATTRYTEEKSIFFVAGNKRMSCHDVSPSWWSNLLPLDHRKFLRPHWITPPPPSPPHLEITSRFPLYSMTQQWPSRSNLSLFLPKVLQIFLRGRNILSLQT